MTPVRLVETGERGIAGNINRPIRDLLAASGFKDDGSDFTGFATAGGLKGYPTKAALDADLAHPAGTLAQVTNDPTAANNTVYRKEGASGAGAWVAGEDRVSVVANGVAAITGGSSLSDAQLKEMALAEAFTITAVTARDADSGLLTTATITWRDGSAGTLTGTVNAAVGAYSKMVYTHTASGKTATLTIGREADGTVAWTSIVVTS